MMMIVHISELLNKSNKSLPQQTNTVFVAIHFTLKLTDNGNDWNITKNNNIMYRVTKHVTESSMQSLDKVTVHIKHDTNMLLWPYVNFY